MQSVVHPVIQRAPRLTGASTSPFRSSRRSSLAGLALLPLLASVAGCGNNYRPVVSAINPVGPSAQPEKYAVALADPGNGLPGVATLINFSGDTVVGTLNTAARPTYLVLDTANEGYVLHNDTGLIEAFTASQLTPANPTFITRNITQTTLPASSQPTTAIGLAAVGAGTPGALYVVEGGTTRVAALSAGSPPSIRQEFPVDPNPTYVVGSPASARVYVLSAGAVPGTSTGSATGVENSLSNAISGVIPVGRNPVYGVVNSDSRRAFILNKAGDATSGANGTVSVINIQANTLDTTPRIVVGPNPLWADVDDSINELAVLNAGTGTGPGSLSIINIPLCSSLTTTSNANCNLTNPIDAVGFGTVLATIPVGMNPVQVAILQDQNKAYVANANGTVTVIDMQRLVATKTITVGGTLNWITATSGTPTGKVYVTASNTQVATAIRTDTDEVVATIPIQGNGLSIKVTAQ